MPERAGMAAAARALAHDRVVFSVGTRVHGTAVNRQRTNAADTLIAYRE